MRRMFDALSEKDASERYELDNAGVVQKVYDAFTEDRLEQVADVISPGFVEHTLAPDARGIDSAREWFTTLRSAFPDGRYEVEDVIAEGDQVTVVTRFTATHQGEFLGMAATGRQLSVHGIDWARVEGGQITDHWATLDMSDLRRQLGLAGE